MHLRTARFALCLFMLASPAAADLIIGQVVGPNGAGLPGVGIDAIDLINGGQATLANDSTDAGGFFTTTIPAGVYRIIFKPAPPPASTLLVVEVNNVVVSGTNNMGTITLPQGVSLAGRTVDVNGFPVANVNLDVVNLATGLGVPVQGDATNAFGNFTIVVPTTAIEVQFRTDNVVPTLAPIAMQLTLSANTSLGDVTLEPGFLLQGIVRKSGALPVVGADIDVLESVSGDQLFTPNDNTNSSGNFSVVVPAGTYDVEICPNAADLLVATELLALSVAGNTNVGIITLIGGVVLSGTITKTGGAPVQNADVDLRLEANGVAVVLCGDNSNASGNYSVVVPTGTFTVTFSPPASSCLGQDFHTGVVISGNQVLNGVLPGVAATNVNYNASISPNTDLLSATKAILGAPWTATLSRIPATAAGTITLTLKRAKHPNPNGGVAGSPPFGRVLIAGPLLATLTGAHNGSTGSVSVGVPLTIGYCGLHFTAQARSTGGSVANIRLSSAVDTTIGTF
ncbi:MAG: carboxypeptidase regulatory-like domain-containing protein [Planctomycetes bacterium]|nr:carboxypeptidase regulatory-like domain-containing protein [Planctomycetota bacterium]